MRLSIALSQRIITSQSTYDIQIVSCMYPGSMIYQHLDWYHTMKPSGTEHVSMDNLTTK